jgi:hypothetical protein
MTRYFLPLLSKDLNTKTIGPFEEIERNMTVHSCCDILGSFPLEVWHFF